jgi:hypothetical protein
MDWSRLAWIGDVVPWAVSGIGAAAVGWVFYANRKARGEIVRNAAIEGKTTPLPDNRAQQARDESGPR